MNPFLRHLIAHAQGQAPAIEPRLPGRFETPGYLATDWAGEAGEYPEAPRAPSPSPTEPAAAALEPPVPPSPEEMEHRAPGSSRRRKPSEAGEKEKPQVSPPPAPTPPRAPSEAPETLRNPLPEPPRNPSPQPPRRIAERQGQVIEEESLLPPPPVPRPSSPHPESPEPEVAGLGLEPPRPAPALEAPPVLALAPRAIPIERGSSLLPPPRSSPSEPQAPTIQVHIGRIEVRALFDPPPEQPKPRAAPRGMSLEEFLRRQR